MDFRIADTFTDSLARLTADEQKAAKTTAFDLQVNLKHPGLQFHKLDKARDSRFASVRVSRGLRVIVHRTQSSLLLCYVGHHDDAYDWAERRKLEIHPMTGAAQLVEVRETIQEIKVPRYVDVDRPPKPKPLLFTGVSPQTLLNYGVPNEWLADVQAATEDTLFTIAEHLPSEASDALLELATGSTPQPAIPVKAPAGVLALGLTIDPFEHPDALRRFRLMPNLEELQRALDFPWDKWTVFLHPQQRSLVERAYIGPARVSGSAGTGKTVVAVHRAVHLARSNPETRVLLTTFSDALANALRTMLRRLIGNEPRLAERIEVGSINAIARRLYERLVGPPHLAMHEMIVKALRDAAAATADNSFSDRFVLAEWEQIVDAWQVKSWEAYRDVPRLGRKIRLPEKSRVILWSIFEKAQHDLDARGLQTYSGLFTRLAEKLGESARPIFDFAVVDESQDVSIAQLRFLAALGGKRPNALFFSGDIGQRIFQSPFSWKSLGVDVRGRSFTLRVNYRTSHQIRTQADRLLAPELSDVDGITEKRRGTTSTFNGPPPTIVISATAEDETAAVSDWLVARTKEGTAAGEIGVFVRSAAQFARARAALDQVKIPYVVLDERLDTSSAAASLCTMHLAKGLEFRTVAVLACDDDVIPLRERIEAVGDEADLEEVYASERHLLYVACTRARDHLLVSAVKPGSEFLDDLRM
ncbi:MAG: UvrD-helicase domain-containing protein [Candidatus Eremiobacteraeota bacterium]|nr:UvrD-helicase domain-containing protein [Candidatus Eremiobacteraeota bacterium]